MKRLIIVLNPTHYLNAAEYVHSLDGGENHILVLTRFSKGIEAIDALGAHKLFTKIHRVEMVAKDQIHSDVSFWRKNFDILKPIFQELNPDEIVVGNLVDNNIYPLILWAKSRISKLTLLDDGTPSLNLAHTRFNGTFRKVYHNRNYKNVLKHLYTFKWLLHFKSLPNKVSFFSLFELDVRQPDELIANDYAWVQSKVSKIINDEIVYFIGSHIVDRKLLGEKDYLNSIIEVKKYYQEKGKSLIYIHHRGESEHMKAEVSKLCKTISFDLPLELAFLEEKKPYEFAGHFSSALFTLSRIYRDSKVRAFLFSDNKIKGTSNEPKDYILRLQKTIQSDSKIEVELLSSS